MRTVTHAFAALVLLMAAGTASCGPSSEQQRADTEAALEREENASRKALYDLAIERLDEDDSYRFRQELTRVSMARGYGMDDNSTYDEIIAMHTEQNRAVAAQELNLPASASWPQIHERYSQQRSIRWHADRARTLGVPVSTSEEELDRLESERRRLEAARREHLPDNASWDDIFAAVDRRDHAERAARYGLLATATEDEIRRRINERINSPEARARMALYEQQSEARRTMQRLEVELRVAKQRVEALERGLPADATTEDIENYEIDRVRRIVAIIVGLPETAGWGEIYDATEYPGRPYT